jgi:hypothetical protein
MRKHNPWIGALWCTGVTLTVAAFLAQVWQVTFWYQATSDLSPGPVVMFLQRLADALVTPALYVGFGTIGGLLFLHARGCSRRSSEKRRPSARA